MTEDGRTGRGQAEVLDHLERLSALLEKRAITGAEFDAQKARILAGGERARVPAAEGPRRRDARLAEVKRHGIGYRLCYAFFISALGFWLVFIPVLGWIAWLAAILFSIAVVFGYQAEYVEGNCPSCDSKLTIHQLEKAKTGHTCSICKKRLIFDPEFSTLASSPS